MGWQSLTESMAPKIRLGKGGSKEVREFSQVEDFGRDIKVGQDASSTPTPTTTGAGAAATVGSPPPKLPPNSDNPTAEEGRPRYFQQHQPTSQQPYSPRSILTPTYEPYYSNNFVDDSSHRHIIIHNDDPSERPTTSHVASTALPPLPLRDQRRLPPFDPRWHTIKRILTLLSMTWSIVILVLSCLFAVHGGLADGVGLWSLPITIAALLWNTAELLTYCVRSHLAGSAAEGSVRRGLHPGAHVGGHLCFWLTCALAIYLSSSVYSDVLDTRRDCNSVAAAVAAADGGVATGSADFEVLLRGHCNSNYHFASNLGLYREGFYVPGLQALLAMFVMATVTHFALFVRACVEVDQRNQLRFSREEDDLADDAAAGARAWPGQWEQYYRRSMRKGNNKSNNSGRGRSRGGAPEMAQQYV